MKYYVVIDTNVIVAAFYTNNINSSTFKVIDLLYTGNLIPLYSLDVIEEYKDVLNRKEFNITKEKIGKFINFLYQSGIEITPSTISIDMKDITDIKFYELVMDKTIINNKFLITGNIKDFPKSPIIVEPDEFLKIYNSN